MLDAWCGMWICMRRTDAQEQLAWTSLINTIAPIWLQNMLGYLKGHRQERPLDFLAILKVLKNSWILACGLCFTWETLFWSFFCWGTLRSREITYAKNLSFLSNILWRSSVERKTKETFLLFWWTANRQTVYSVFHRMLAVFKSKENSV